MALPVEITFVSALGVLSWAPQRGHVSTGYELLIYLPSALLQQLQALVIDFSRHQQLAHEENLIPLIDHTTTNTKLTHSENDKARLYARVSSATTQATQLCPLQALSASMHQLHAFQDQSANSCTAVRRMQPSASALELAWSMWYSLTFNTLAAHHAPPPLLPLPVPHPEPRGVGTASVASDAAHYGVCSCHDPQGLPSRGHTLLALLPFPVAPPLLESRVKCVVVLCPSV